MPDTSSFDWTPERIVVPRGTDEPYNYWDDDSIVVDSTDQDGSDDSFDVHIIASTLRYADGEYADAYLVIDRDEVPDAEVWYVWRRGPLDVYGLFDHSVAARVSYRILGAFTAGFIQSRLELLQQRYPDRKFHKNFFFNNMPLSPDSLNDLLGS